MGSWLKQREVRDGLLQGAVIAAVVMAVALPAWHFLRPKPTPRAAAVAVAPKAAPAIAALPEPLYRRADFGSVRPSQPVQQIATWVADSADNGRVPFAIIDKRGAHLYVFDASGRLLGNSPILLGYAAGDDTVPGIGQRPIDQIKPGERTTPAGRFVSQPGRNALNETVVWVDYTAAVSMHRVRLTNPAERRAERLASPTPADNRISWGCINVPVEFFEQVVWPNVGSHRAVVYVLPEKKPLAAVFPDAARTLIARAG